MVDLKHDSEFAKQSIRRWTSLVCYDYHWCQLLVSIWSGSSMPEGTNCLPTTGESPAPTLCVVFFFLPILASSFALSVYPVHGWGRDLWSFPFPQMHEAWWEGVEKQRQEVVSFIQVHIFLKQVEKWVSCPQEESFPNEKVLTASQTDRWIRRVVVYRLTTFFRILLYLSNSTLLISLANLS